ncbi:MAG: acyl-CoA thioesterase [Caldilineaceae bacterium]|nr:acyl-CoA thioesterase [Caldilineaceae bacterium]
MDAKSKTVADSMTRISQIMNPEHANVLGNVHGGVLLKLCDECGGITAARHARRVGVTVAVDSMAFHEPVQVGQLLRMRGRITYVGRSSMEVEVIVQAEDLLTGEISHTNSAYYIFVALDEKGLPTEVPRLEITNEAERRRFEEGEERQRQRLKRAGKKLE